MSTLTPDLPEPEWWSRARAMAERGASQAEIARKLHKDRKAVKYVLDPEFRLKHRARTLARNQRHTPRKVPRDGKRARAREYAREQWRAAGRVESLFDVYRRLECL